MKALLKTYETMSIVCMFAYLVIMLMALSEGAMNVAVGMMLLSLFCIMLVSWQVSSTYKNWKQRKGYEE